MTAKRSQALATVVTNPQSTQPLMLAAYLPPAYVGTPWTGSIWGVGGSGGYGYSGTSIPAWMTATPTTVLGVTYLLLSGTPTAGGSGYCTTTVTDSSTTVTTKSFRVNVNYAIAGAGGGLSINAIPPPAYTNNPYSLDLTTYLSNPTLPLTSTVLTTGTLPTGMTLHSATGIVDASSVTGTTQNCVFTVTDGAGAVAVLHLQLRVKPGLSATTYAPAGVLGQPYQGKVTVSGGSGKYSVSQVVANPLPTGLAVDAKSGNITGQPTALTPTTGAPTTHFQITDLVTGEVIITTVLSGGSKNIVIGSGVPPVKKGHFYGGSDSTGSPNDIDYLSQYFGNGGDGTLSASSGTTTLTRDTYYTNVTLSGTAVLDLAGFTLYVSDTLDITAAQAGAIVSTIAGGGRAWGGIPGFFAAGGTTTGVAGGDAQTIIFGRIGGASRRGGSGGNGTSGTGGIAGQAAGSSAVVRSPDWLRGDYYYSHPDLSITQGVFFLAGGLGGSAGGSGGGNGSAGGNSGAGGYGGAHIVIFARRINRGASTAAGCIDASGRAGSNGVAGAASGRGGGGAGGGGSGGGTRLVYSELLGSTATNALRANGANGGDGGASGGGAATAGHGGDGGDSGCIIINDILTPQTTITTGTLGSAASGATHGTGGVCQANL